MHLELPLHKETNDWEGIIIEIGFWNKHTFSRFVRPTKAFLLNEIILLVSKFNSLKLVKSLNNPSSILLIAFKLKSNFWSKKSPLNVDESIVASPLNVEFLLDEIGFFIK